MFNFGILVLVKFFKRVSGLRQFLPILYSGFAIYKRKSSNLVKWERTVLERYVCGCTYVCVCRITYILIRHRKFRGIMIDINTDKMGLSNNIKPNAFFLKHFIQNISKERFANINKQPAQET